MTLTSEDLNESEELYEGDRIQCADFSDKFNTRAILFQEGYICKDGTNDFDLIIEKKFNW